MGVTLEIKKEVWGLKYDHKISFPKQKTISKWEQKWEVKSLLFLHIYSILWRMYSEWRRTIILWSTLYQTYTRRRKNSTKWMKHLIFWIRSIQQHYIIINKYYYYNHLIYKKKYQYHTVYKTNKIILLYISNLYMTSHIYTFL